MSLLDKLHDKALSAKKKHVKYPLLIASGIADWIAGTYGEIRGHGEAANASGEKDYKLYDEGLTEAALGEGGAFAAAVYTRNKAGAAVLGADILVRFLNAAICLSKGEQLKKDDPGVIGTARTIAYKIANRRKRPDVAAEPVEDDGTEETPLIFPDPLPEPVKDDEMRILEGKLEDKVSDAGETEPEDVLQFEPAPSLAEELPPGPFEPHSCPEPLQEPFHSSAAGEGYELPDILEEDEPSCGGGGRGRSCGGGGSCGTSYRGDCGTKPAKDKPLGESAPQMPSSKPKVDIGPLSRAQDDDDPLGSADEEETGNKLF